MHLFAVVRRSDKSVLVNHILVLDDIRATTFADLKISSSTLSRESRSRFHSRDGRLRLLHVNIIRNRLMMNKRAINRNDIIRTIPSNSSFRRILGRRIRRRWRL
jgi:hypothetical protein